MKTTLKYALIALFTFLMTSSVIAQEWTKEQKEVWQTVENTWSKWKANDVTGAAANLHEKYQGWNSEMPLPMGKETMTQMFTEMKDMEKLDYYNIEPARITISGNAAVVDYYFNYSVTRTMGTDKKQVQEKGKNVEFYVKEGGKWLLLGDMTVNDPKMKDMMKDM
jgi:hypothetical protein